MTTQHGDFIWYELMTADPDAAAAFYGDVVGWRSRPFDAGIPGGYHIFSAGEEDAGGLMTLPGGGARPGWIGYVAVRDVNAAAAALVADGATQLVPPTDIPDVGRFAVIADPQGAAFVIMRGASEHDSPAFSPDKAGHTRWNELSTTDPDAAFAFYSRHFGWTKGEAMPMGELGIYQLLDHGGQTFGALMRAQPQQPEPAWTFYFGVADIDIAAEKTIRGGGRVLHGPAEVPGGEFIIVAEDPQGVVFALVGPRAA